MKKGSSSKPLILRVKTQQDALKYMTICEDHGWKCIIGMEPDKPEDISDLERKLRLDTLGKRTKRD